MFKTIVRKYYEAADIAASAKTFKEQVQEGIEQRFAPSLLEGEEMPNFSLAQDLVVRLLERLDTDVMEVDSSQTLELVGSAQLRDLRNEQADKLRVTLRQVRFLLDRAFPPATVGTVFRVRRVSNLRPVQLQLLAQTAASVLREATQRCTEFLYGLYRLAGLDYHAARIGPKIRKR